MKFYGSPLFVVLTVAKRGPAGGNGQRTRRIGTERSEEDAKHGWEISRPTFLSVSRGVLRIIVPRERRARGKISFAKTNRARFHFPKVRGSSSIYFVPTNLRAALFLFSFAVFFFFSDPGLTHQLLWVSLRPSFMVARDAGATLRRCCLYGNCEMWTSE